MKVYVLRAGFKMLAYDNKDVFWINLLEAVRGAGPEGLLVRIYEEEITQEHWDRLPVVRQVDKTLTVRDWMR